MDLVNSVTQNSNNTNITMENLPPAPSSANNYGGFSSSQHDNGHDDDQGDNNSYSKKQQQATLEMQQAPSSADDTTPSLAVAPVAAAARPAPQHVPDYLKAIGMDPKKFWPKKYRFTREKSPGLHNPLTIAQRNFYENNGYIVIDDCGGSHRLLESIKSEHDKSSLVSEFFVDKLVAKNGKLLQYVKCFCDERLMLMTYQLVDTFQSQEQARAIMDSRQQQAASSQRQRLHRDWVYLPFRPMDKVVCAITAVEPLDHVILVVPGTHRVGQCTISSTLESISAVYETSQERSPPPSQPIVAGSSAAAAAAIHLFESSPENLSSIIEKSRKGFKYVNLKPGQTLFYHPGLVHGFSDDLVNFQKRQLATIAYYAAADCEYIEMRRQPQDNFRPSELPISLAHFGDQDPSDYNSWINRPRLLTGHDLKASL